MPSNYLPTGWMIPHQFAIVNQSPGYADVPMDGNWKSLSPSVSITATGESFFVSCGATAFNGGGTGPLYRLIFAAFDEAGVCRGETEFTIIPGYIGYYQTGYMGCMIESLPTGKTHTYELKVLAEPQPNSVAVIMEANMSVLAFQ